MLLGLAAIGVFGAVVACSGGDSTEGAARARANRLEDILAGALPERDADRFELDLAARKEFLLAECMADSGLAYEARDPHSLVDVVTNTDFSSIDYAREYGFGITTFPTFTGTDPNAALVDALPADQRLAYDEQRTECAESANTRAQQEFGVEEANRKFAAVDDRIRADSRFHAAESEWTTCATAKGYDQRSRTALIDSLHEEYDPIMLRLQTQVTDSGIAPEHQDATTHELAAHDPEFQQLKNKEKTAAVDTFPCSRELDRVYVEIYRALER